MKKRANEIFKLKEPDVKIIALDDLAREGISCFFIYWKQNLIQRVRTII